MIQPKMDLSIFKDIEMYNISYVRLQAWILFADNNALSAWVSC